MKKEYFNKYMVPVITSCGIILYLFSCLIFRKNNTNIFNIKNLTTFLFYKCMSSIILTEYMLSQYHENILQIQDEEANSKTYIYDRLNTYIESYIHNYSF